MAENVLETRILLRYDTYSNWMNSDVILKQGEAAIAVFPEERVVAELSNTTPQNTPPAIGIKIGDGRSYFYQLPWVQAVAADVYKWAKASKKPTYSANEIDGLQNYIEDNFHISGDITIAPRIYEIVQGTGDNANKYYLRYKENNDEGEWIVDTNHVIDLTIYNDIYNWIGSRALDRYATVTNLINSLLNDSLKTLNKTDNSVSHQFVTSVSETNGIINVSRAQPSMPDITGTATVAQGGTGRDTLTLDNVLVGNGTDAVKLVPIAETVANNDYLITNRLVKQYVDNATAGLTGAMHFIGDAGVTIISGSAVDPRIQNYDFSKVQPGDVILSNTREFVWDGSSWVLLGDEGSYAVKGSIKDVDIDPDAAIQQSKIYGLAATFDTKVDKQEGKTLTSNDFTDELKDKLDNIQDNAQVNAIEHIYVNGVESQIKTINQVPKVVNLEISEFDEASQLKLQDIAAGAEVNTIEKIIFDGEEIAPDENKVVSITSDPHTEHENKIEQIFINGSEWVPNAQKQVKITIDQAALNLNVVEGAQIPNIHTESGLEDIPQVSKKLQLERIAATGNVKDLLQSNEEYITLYCGTSTQII